jgi:hypothetical protein
MKKVYTQPQICAFKIIPNKPSVSGCWQIANQQDTC